MQHLPESSWQCHFTRSSARGHGPTPPSRWTVGLLGSLADQATTGIVIMATFYPSRCYSVKKQEVLSRSKLEPSPPPLLSCFVGQHPRTRANNRTCKVTLLVIIPIFSGTLVADHQLHCWGQMYPARFVISSRQTEVLSIRELVALSQPSCNALGRPHHQSHPHASS